LVPLRASPAALAAVAALPLAVVAAALPLAAVERRPVGLPVLPLAPLVRSALMVAVAVLRSWKCRRSRQQCRRI
jgi:hypothetical protein